MAFVQIIFQYLSTKNNLLEILDVFILNYKSTYVESFKSKKKIKFEFNTNFLKKLSNSFEKYTLSTDYLNKINSLIDFNRKFEKWDIINQSITLAILSEFKYSEINKLKIILNDYLNISKNFIDQSDIGKINAIVDKIINEKK